MMIRKGSNRRSWRNFVAHSLRGRAKFTVLLMVTGVASLAVFFLGASLLLGRQLTAASAPGEIALVVASANRLLIAAAFLFALALALTFVVGILTIHRIYGPLVPLLRQIESLGKGDYQARVRLRSGDEHVQLMDALNALGEQLERQRNEKKVRFH